MNIPHEQQGFFTLIQRVGSKGKYQKQLLLIFYIIWFITAFLVLGLSFVLMPVRFQCGDQLDRSQCRQKVCLLSVENRSAYKKQPLVQSLMQEFTDYQCEDESTIANYKMLPFAGILAGYIFFSYFSDNFGRKIGMVLTLLTSLLGLLMICHGRSLNLAGLGLFLAGAGLESNLRVNLAIINEVVDYQVRQVYSVILQTAYGMAGIIIGIAYYYLRQWRMITIIFCQVPLIISIFLVFFYLQETPTYLSQRGSHLVLASLKRIALINGLQCDVTENDIQKIISVRKQSTSNNLAKHRTICDLFNFNSLKKSTIYLSIISACLSSLYISPNSAMESFSFDIFLLQIIISIPDLVIYIFTCKYIEHVQRRKAGIMSFSIGSLLLFIGALISSKGQYQIIVRIAILFLSRCFVSYYYGVFYIYIVQIYPESVRNIGFSTVSAVGALGSTLTQKIVSIAQIYDHNIFLYLLFFCLVCLYASRKLPQTFGQPLQLQISELRVKKINMPYQPSLEQSYSQLDNSSQSERKQPITSIQTESPTTQQSIEKE